MIFNRKKQPVRHDAEQSEFIRRFKANPFIFVGTIIILIIVIVAFVLVPAIVPEAGRMVELNFGSYNNIPINYTPGSYFAQVRENFARYRQNTTNETNYIEVSLDVWRGAFEEAVIRTGILEEVKQSGYTPSQEQVDKEVAQQFQVDGVFDAPRYRQLDRSTRMSLWRGVRDSLIERQYREDLTSLRIPSKETEFIAAMASPQRSFDMAVFPLSAYPDSEIVTYAAGNSDLFRFTHLSRITVGSSEAEAQTVLNSIQDGTTTFEEAAGAHSQDGYADRGGDMGIKMIYELATEIPDADVRNTVTGLQAGQYSPVVQVPAGWAFFRAEVSPYPADTADSGNISKIRSYLLDQERGRMEDWLIAQAEALIVQIKEIGFDAAAEAQGITTQSFGPLPLNYGGVDLFGSLRSSGIEELVSADSNENFWRLAFFTPLETPSTPLVLGGNVVVLYPKEEIPAEEPVIETVKSIYSSYWLSYNAEMGLRYYFLRSGKLEDRFYDAFYQFIYNPFSN
ncbi:MAG: peptidylprolyl isomerase [Spirochaetaceae bacterium]|jgi:hypothetical protein|nr:peptidylprolyl isomerase [Spirochaetaceae bacterium]